MKNDPYVKAATDCLPVQIRRLKQELRGISRDTPFASTHQARVASRRLLVMLRVFRDLYPHSHLKEWVKSLRGLARKLGRARDLDVQREILESWAAASAIGQGFAMHAVAAQWATARQKLTPRLGRAVRQFRRAKTLSRMESALPEAGQEGAYGKKHFHRRAVKDLERCVSRVRQKSLPADDTALLHQLRSSFRKLRYTLEICRPLDPAPIDKLIELTHQFQDVIGRLHDIDVLSERLSRAKASDIPAATSFYLQRLCAQEHAKLYRKFEQMWKRWKKQKLRGLIPET